MDLKTMVFFEFFWRTWSMIHQFHQFHHGQWWDALGPADTSRQLGGWRADQIDQRINAASSGGSTANQRHVSVHALGRAELTGMFESSLWFFVFFPPQNLKISETSARNLRDSPWFAAVRRILAANWAHLRLTLPPSRGIALPQVVGQVQVWRQEKISEVDFWMGNPRNISLWLCQNSYRKWQFIVDFPIESGDFPQLCWITRGYPYLEIFMGSFSEDRIA